MEKLVEWGLELIRRTTSDISSDVEMRLRSAYENEEQGSTAKNVLGVILENIELARKASTPICQDTGLVSFYVTLPKGMIYGDIKRDLTEAVRIATKEGLLRPNSVDPVKGRNSGDNTGGGLPYFEFEEHESYEIIIDLMQKGGGCENVGAQYRLPDMTLKAGRDLNGVEKCVIDAVFRAQGFGCAPGVIGVCIGGDRAHGYLAAKKQLLRSLDDVNPDPQLAEFENRLYQRLNELGIGPMGFGGKTTVLGVKACAINRHPASYYVSISYCCWADRHRRLVIKGDFAQII